MNKKTIRTLLHLSWVAVLVLVISVGCGSQNDTTPREPDLPDPSPRPSDQQLREARNELAEWAEGRWLDYTVTWDEGTERVLLGVIADTMANDVAITGYCDILSDVARSYFSGYQVAAGITRDGEVTICR